MENRYFKLNQTVYDVRYGKGEVIGFEDSPLYPVKVLFGDKDICYTLDGKNTTSDTYPSLYQVEPIVTENVEIIDDIEIVDEFTKGELVWIKINDEWILRYYSHKEKDEYVCFSSQKTEELGYNVKEIKKFEDCPLERQIEL